MQTENNFHATENTNEQQPDMSKWYNDKAKLWLSLLIWPVFLYGAYKTQVLSKKTKNIIACACVFILIMGALKGGGKGTSIQTSGDPSAMVKEAVANYIMEKSGDPRSYSSISWGNVEHLADGNYRVKHYFNSRVSQGVVITQICEFTVDGNGNVIGKVTY